MSVKLEMSIKVELPNQVEASRYPQTKTLAELDIDVPDMVGWSLYRYVIEQCTNAEFKITGQGGA